MLANLVFSLISGPSFTLKHRNGAQLPVPSLRIPSRLRRTHTKQWQTFCWRMGIGQLTRTAAYGLMFLHGPSPCFTRLRFGVVQVFRFPKSHTLYITSRDTWKGFREFQIANYFTHRDCILSRFELKHLRTQTFMSNFGPHNPSISCAQNFSQGDS